MSHLDLPNIELGVTRALEHVGSLEETKDGNGSHLKLYGMEDDDDDGDKETTQKKLQRCNLFTRE